MMARHIYVLLNFNMQSASLETLLAVGNLKAI